MSVLKVPGALIGQMAIATLLWCTTASLWWIVAIDVALALLMYTAYILQHPTFGEFGDIFQEIVGTTRIDNFHLSTAAFGFADLTPWWHTPTAYFILIGLVPILLVTMMLTPLFDAE